MWYVYLISDGKRTYIGSTTDVVRRLRQHNRELTGGAKSTASGAPRWKLVCQLSGFVSRGEAYRWEKIVKNRARGYHNRVQALVDLSEGKCPKGKLYEVPPGLVIYGV